MAEIFKKDIEKSYLLVLGIITLFLMLGYFSYAIFTINVEKEKAISIITGTLSPTLTSTDSAFANNQIVVSASTTKGITVKLTNNNNRDAKFNFYYIGSLPSGVEVGYVESTKNIPPDATGIVITQGKSQEYTISIKNSSSSSYVLQIGSDGGLSDKTLTFPSDGHLFEKIRKTGTETLLAKVNVEDLDYTAATSEQQKEMWTFSHEPGTQQAGWKTEELIDYRYIGKNPNNYIIFNDEVWRIIGVFTTEDKNGNKAKRMKIIRNDFLGTMAWNMNEDINEWTTATLKSILNEGSYYNSNYSFVNTGLKEDIKSKIESVKWYLGGSDSPYDITASQFYAIERGTQVYSKHNTFWVGEIGLLYASDYGYATSGGQFCLNADLYSWDNSLYSECRSNDWLYDDNTEQWTLSLSTDSRQAFRIISSGFVTTGHTTANCNVRPVLFLKSDIEITSGDGSSTNPYTIQ